MKKKRGIRGVQAASLDWETLYCIVLQVRSTLTISLPKELRKSITAAAKGEGVTSSEFVRKSIKAAVFRRALRAARAKLVPIARSKGIYTDEDVFKIVS